MNNEPVGWHFCPDHPLIDDDWAPGYTADCPYHQKRRRRWGIKGADTRTLTK